MDGDRVSKEVSGEACHLSKGCASVAREFSIPGPAGRRQGPRYDLPNELRCRSKRKIACFNSFILKNKKI